MKDILLSETGNGGDIRTENNDISLSSVLITLLYTCLFGGNKEASTTGNEIETEERFDWWGNSLFYDQKKNFQFNSETEKTLNNVPLNSSGRLKIKNAVEIDLEKLSSFSKTEVDVLIDSSTRVSIYIKITPLDNREEKVFQVLWDTLKTQAIIQQTV